MPLGLLRLPMVHQLDRSVNLPEVLVHPLYIRWWAALVFVLTTLGRHAFPKGSQVFHCYGRRSNADLLAHYGFVLGCNKYEALQFRATVDFGWRKQFEEGKDGGPAQADDMKVQKKIKLKETRLRDEIFAYIRATLMNQQGQAAAEGKDVPQEFIVRTPEGEERKVSRADVADQSHLLVSSPVDPAFEMLVVAFAIQLLQ